jgi:hypothetical protein
MLKRTLTALVVAIVATLTTATAALAGYPPPADVLGKTVHKVSPEQSLAFTGSNTMLWIALALVLLVIGVSMLVWSRARSPVGS